MYEGFQYEDLHSERLFLEIISKMVDEGNEEAIMVELNTPRTTTSGIDMGAPGTKGLLTLWQLAAQEELKETLEGRFTTEKSVIADSGWQIEDRIEHFAASNPQYSYLNDLSWAKDESLVINALLNDDVGLPPDKVVIDNVLLENAGDDLLGIGQIGRLEQLIKFQVSNDSIVSEKKFLLSPILGIICEQAVLRTTKASVGASSRSNVYNKHILVDAYKVRLFSPCSKSQETQDGSNPAIGKAKKLFELSEPLDSGWSNFEQVGKTYRFSTRMRKFLPKQKNGALAPEMFLPTSFGGLGVTPYNMEYHDVIQKISEEHAFLIAFIVKLGHKDKGTFRVLSSYSKDRAARGIEIKQSIIDELFNNLRESVAQQPLTVERTLETYGLKAPEFGGYRIKRTKLQSLGYVSESDLIQTYNRAWLQTQSLLGNSTDDPWNMQEWPKRQKAFQRSVSKYAKTLRAIHYLEDYVVDRVELGILMTNLGPKKLRDFSFFEEKFWHPLTHLAGQPEERIIQQIVDSLMTLELPAINMMAWFPKDPTNRDDEIANEAEF
jgi:hypothetical protein